MINVIKKDKVFYQSINCQKFFDLLKKQFTTILNLAYFNFKEEYIIKIDASNNISIGVLSQYYNNGLLYLVALFSWKYSPQEINYKIYDKKLLAIIITFKELYSMLEETGLLIKILINYKNLMYFMSIKQFSCQKVY